MPEPRATDPAPEDLTPEEQAADPAATHPDQNLDDPEDQEAG